MANIPLISRLSYREYLALFLGFFILGFETLISLIILCLPERVISWCYSYSRTLFIRFKPKAAVVVEDAERSSERKMALQLIKARDFQDLCRIHGYTHEEHVVMTDDGYLLTLHRLPSRKGQDRSRRDTGRSTGKNVVYLHHGLLMNSEIWVCLTNAERCLAFVLVELGYDVWLGNNRGNKYSKKSVHHSPTSNAFWDFSIDDFAWHDIPNSIAYILSTTSAPSLSYIGFSQGTAQAFAALSIHPSLNRSINVFIALAPAMSPAGLSPPIVDGLMKASPTLLFLFFGRKSILSSAAMWQSILYPPIYAAVIDRCVGWLFGWHGMNISTEQKTGAYAHLYSTASVKSVVHWFQIMRTQTFQMYDDEPTYTSPSLYRAPRFPTRNIVTPIVLLWGSRDSLVDIDVMLAELPKDTTVERRLEGYEHVDIIWGRKVDKDVIPRVLEALAKHCPKIEAGEKDDGGASGSGSVVNDEQ